MANEIDKKDESLDFKDIRKPPKVEDDFDLDAFLVENDFLPKENKKPAPATSETPKKTSTRRPMERAVKPSQNTSRLSQDAPSTTTSSSKPTAKRIDPNATMSYEAIGADYPEIPLVEEGDFEPKTTSKKITPRKVSSASANSLLDSTVAKDSNPSRKTSSRPVTDDARTITDATQSTRRTRAGKSAPAKTRATMPPTARKASPTKRSTTLTSLANPEDFHAAELNDNAYRIRGGGKRHNRLSPVLTILMAVVIIAGISVLGYSLNTVLNNIFNEKPVENVVTLTENETRKAIETEMPSLVNFIWLTPEEAMVSFEEAGWNVIPLARMASDNPDPTASGDELVHLNAQDTETILEGYKAGEFSAYDFDQLQKSFNGVWALDLSAGDRGRYAQLKYVNFASISLDNELNWFRTEQGLAGEDSVVDVEDVDSHGNSYIQGYTVIGETTYYWQFIGCLFEEYYDGQDKRKLPDSAVFVKCKIATFDFFGLNTPIPEPPADEAPAEETSDEEATSEEE